MFLPMCLNLSKDTFKDTYLIKNNEEIKGWVTDFEGFKYILYPEWGSSERRRIIEHIKKDIIRTLDDYEVLFR